MSIQGNRYGLLIVDNQSNENWFIGLKKKSQAIEALNHWKSEVELAKNTKVLAARSNNAPRLIAAIEGQRGP